MDRDTALGVAALACVCMLAIALLFGRARRRRNVKFGAVSQHWVSEHVDNVRD